MNAIEQAIERGDIEIDIYKFVYESPIELAEFMLNPENDSYGHKLFRDLVGAECAANEKDMLVVYEELEDDDFEVFERFLEMECEWGGSGGFWITQCLFYADQIKRGINPYGSRP